MSQYLLKLSGSNEIYNIIDWDGIKPLTVPVGYVFEPFVSESVDFINQIDISDNPNTHATQSIIQDLSFEPLGQKSITANTKKTAASGLETPYGQLKIQTTFNEIGGILSNRFAIKDDDKLIMSSRNQDDSKQANYEYILNTLVSAGKPNHIIKFINEDDSLYQLHFLITGSMSVSESYVKESGSLGVINTGGNYYIFSGEVVKDTTPIFMESGSNYGTHISASSYFFENHMSNWIVDIEMVYDVQVGTFYGDFNGTIGGKKVEDILDNQGINATNFGRLKYENSQNFDSTSLILPNYLDMNEAPKRTYFRFNKERNGENWDDAIKTVSEPIDEITLSLDNLDLDSESAYRDMIWQILIGNWKFSELTLTSVEYPETYKKFEILDGVSYQKQFRNNLSPIYYNLPMGRTWGVIDTSNMPDPDFRFRNEHQYSLADGERITYVKLTVREIDSGVDPNRLPQHDDEFSIDIIKGKKKRKEVFEFTSTTTPWQVPSWANKLEIYTIGAGGGGGGGSAAWGHRYEEFSLNEMRINLASAGIGFQFATGGGGGAGGNISVAEFLIDNSLDSTNIGKSVLPRSSNLNIYVGSGGKGGEGLTNNDSDYQVVLAKDIIKNPNLNWIETLLDSKIDADPQSKNWVVRNVLRNQSDVSPLNPNAYWRFQYGKTKGMGKNGAFSSVELDISSNNITNTNIELTKATGGIGGMHGIAMQTYYGMFHYNCAAANHILQEPNALGGGSYLNDSFGNKEVRCGGHGGYGVSMHNTLQPEYGFDDPNLLYYIKFVKINTEKLKINLAPNIPWGDNNDKPNLRIPFGTNYLLKSGETLDVDGWKKYKNGSYEKPTKIAPLGGNGGLGANWTGLENRPKSFMLSLPDYFFKFDIETQHWERQGGPAELDMPDYWYELISKEVLKNITFTSSDRPKIIGDNTLISTNVTAVNGIASTKYEFKLKNTGTLGGLNIYNNTSGTEALLESVTLSERVPTQPESGDDYGQGGGGGAAAYTTDWSQRTTPIQGQNGGDGANGIVIIIAEEL